MAKIKKLKSVSKSALYSWITYDYLPGLCIKLKQLCEDGNHTVICKSEIFRYITIPFLREPTLFKSFYEALCKNTLKEFKYDENELKLVLGWMEDHMFSVLDERSHTYFKNKWNNEYKLTEIKI